MLVGIIKGRCGRHKIGSKTMWMIELNIAGQRFNRQFPDLPRQPSWSARFSPRIVPWRVPQARQQHAA